MLKPNSLLILGAAASPGFPLGSDLKTQIANLLSYRSESGGLAVAGEKWRTFAAARNLGISDNRLLQIGRIVQEGIDLSISIDNYLELKSAEEDLVTCCKLAIADIILKNETKMTRLKADISRHGKPGDFANTWHQLFAQICFQSCPTKADIPEALKRVCVVSFNYDRCIEQFIRVAVMRLYSVTYEEASELTKGFRVLHPYGALGTLPGQSSGKVLTFGQEHNIDLAEIASNLKTFTEQTIEATVLDQIKAETGRAKTITFLGFGYHKPNLEILAPTRQNTVRQVVGTCSGLSDFARSEVSASLSNLFRAWHNDTPSSAAHVTLESESCTDFIDHYRLALVD